MILLDANYILRFLLQDNEEMYEISKECIVNYRCMILNEVFAEVVFVLPKVYPVAKRDIQNILTQFVQYETIQMDSKAMMIDALEIFENKNLDFVDAILCAKSREYDIRTFDKKLNRCIKASILKQLPY